VSDENDVILFAKITFIKEGLVGLFEFELIYILFRFLQFIY